jgi:hypothetical protein
LFRKALTSWVRNLWMRGTLPLAGGIMMTVAFVVSALGMLRPDYGSSPLTIP